MLRSKKAVKIAKCWHFLM